MRLIKLKRKSKRAGSLQLAASKKMRAEGRGPKAESQINKAIQILKKSGVIIYPTETVYGLGADINSREAVERIYEIKGREKTKALSIACLKEDIEKYAEVTDLAKFLIANFLPGPLTLVLKKKETVPRWITNSEYVGIRVPDNELVQKLLKKFGSAITSTSANISGKKDCVSAKEIPAKIKEKVDLIIDEGETKYKGPSTVVQVNGKIKILRHGVIEVWNHGRVC